MAGISPISGPTCGLPTMPPAQTSAVADTPAAQGGLAAGSVASGQSLMALSSTSISATSESLFYQSSPIMADEKALGLAILLMTLQYLQSNDEEEKKGLLALMLALTQQQQGGQQETMMYNASSLSIESTQFVAMSSDAVASAYSGSAGAVQGAPAADAGMGQLSVVA